MSRYERNVTRLVHQLGMTNGGYVHFAQEAFKLDEVMRKEARRIAWEHSPNLFNVLRKWRRENRKRKDTTAFVVKTALKHPHSDALYDFAEMQSNLRKNIEKRIKAK